MDKKSFVLGIATALAIGAGLMAVANDKQVVEGGPRFQVFWENGAGTSNSYVVLDSHTGTTVIWGDTPSGEVRAFTP